MAIRPIDMHVLLPKLHKNDLLKPHVVHRQDNEQQLQQSVNKQDIEEKIKRVNDFEQKESPRVRDDGQRGQGRGSSEDKKEKKDQESTDKEDKKASVGLKRNHIDIKV